MVIVDVPGGLLLDSGAISDVQFGCVALDRYLRLLRHPATVGIAVVNSVDSEKGARLYIERGERPCPKVLKVNVKLCQVPLKHRSLYNQLQFAVQQRFEEEKYLQQVVNSLATISVIQI